MTCSNNLKQLGLALHSYHDAQGTFPISPLLSNTSVGWTALILPYIEQEALGRTINPTLPAYDVAGNSNRLAGGNRIAMFLCPSYSEEHSSSTIDNTPTGNAFITHYVGNAGPTGTNPATGTPYPMNCATGNVQGPLACDGVLPFYPRYSASAPTVSAGVKIAGISDGTSNTLMVFESAWSGLEVAPGSFRAWQRGGCWNNATTASKNVTYAMRSVKFNGGGNYNDVSMGSNHPGGCNAVMADGSVRFLQQSIDLNTVLKPLASRDGGEVVNVD